MLGASLQHLPAIQAFAGSWQQEHPWLTNVAAGARDRLDGLSSR
jgi:hypothetical protein